MRNFASLRILEQGMEIVSTAHDLTSKYTQTDMAGLIKEINLLAIQIPSSVAASSKQKTDSDYEFGLKQALDSVKDIETKLTDIPSAGTFSHPLYQLKRLVDAEHQLIEKALGHSETRIPNRPLKRSRLSVAATMKSRAPMEHIKVSQGVQVELF